MVGENREGMLSRPSWRQPCDRRQKQVDRRDRIIRLHVPLVLLLTPTVHLEVEGGPVNKHTSFFSGCIQDERGGGGVYKSRCEN